MKTKHRPVTPDFKSLRSAKSYLRGIIPPRVIAKVRGGGFVIVSRCWANRRGLTVVA